MTKQNDLEGIYLWQSILSLIKFAVLIVLFKAVVWPDVMKRVDVLLNQAACASHAELLETGYRWAGESLSSENRRKAKHAANQKH